jgi:hypothetical protein
MATHTPHADLHSVGLAADCPRCLELAERPLELDALAFAQAWQRMIDVEWGDSSYANEAEAKLGSKLYEWAVFLERRTPVNPRELPEFVLFGAVT